MNKSQLKGSTSARSPDFSQQGTGEGHQSNLHYLFEKVTQIFSCAFKIKRSFLLGKSLKSSNWLVSDCSRAAEHCPKTLPLLILANQYSFDIFWPHVIGPFSTVK